MIEKTEILVAFATRWGSQFGGINSFNADLLAATASTYKDRVKVSCVVLSCTNAEIEAANRQGVTLITLSAPSADTYSDTTESAVLLALENAAITKEWNDVTWLGHDRITGQIALTVARRQGGRLALIHHMSYKCYETFAESNESEKRKTAEQEELFRQAEVVLAVGPFLRDALSDMLDGASIPMLIPGLPEIRPRPVPKFFSAFISGRLNDGTRKIKQAYLGVAAFGHAIQQCSKDQRLPDALHRSNEPYLLLRGVEFETTSNTTDRTAEQDLRTFAEKYADGVYGIQALPFTTDRVDLFNDLGKSSVAMMPSWHEGFGLVAWEAIAAGVPLILSQKSGVYRLLNEFENGLYRSMVTVIEVRGSNQEPWFHPSDLDGLAGALISVAKDPSAFREKAARLRQNFLKNFSWDTCARTFAKALGWDSDDSPNVASQPSSPPSGDHHDLNRIVLSPSSPTDFSSFHGKGEPESHRNISEIQSEFASTSAIGRHWRRDIAGTRIPNRAVEEILEAILAGKRSILLTGLPGSGKTCTMLDVQETLEAEAELRNDLLPIFIQASEFADRSTAHEREHLGLPEKWVDNIQRVALAKEVVVVIDSLDVLSIAREHGVLKYFLAQIDRLLSIPKVKVVSACREFDRQYDRRIAERNWDLVLSCPLLSWDDNISPLLQKLKIDPTPIDAATRELIRNPRELALFVDLAMSEGSFNVVTSQALAHKYLAKVVGADPALGEPALQAIEAIANEMLSERSLAVPRQRFSGEQSILRALLSNYVLYETKDEKLTFGHQTLLDVLVVSRAFRRGVTLNEFIRDLSPVPFVRPSIRTFIAQLAVGERHEFRAQIRTVLTGNSPFHLRRLVAESFAEQKPDDGDWALINELRFKHREVFQVIYLKSDLIEWHYFWIRHLIPALKDARDAESLLAHANRISFWKKEDSSGVLGYWHELLLLDWIDASQIASAFSYQLDEIESPDAKKLESILIELLKLPRPQHSSLGVAIARFVKRTGQGDSLLWQFVAGEIKDEDVHAFRFNDKLHCQFHEFGNSNRNFLLQRMLDSNALLDLALERITYWSALKVGDDKAAGRYWDGFLDDTSYRVTHSQSDFRHIDSEHVLFDAIEAAILQNAKNNSGWWLKNREKLASHSEGALRYFAILALTQLPENNMDLVATTVCDRSLLQSKLSFEVGTLIKIAFIQLPAEVQDAAIAEIMQIFSEYEGEKETYDWIRREKVQLLLAIPAHLRTRAAQKLIDESDSLEGLQVRRPSIGIRGGMVGAPFPFEIFLDSVNANVLRLLSHYDGHRDFSGDDFLIGGQREVGGQLREAASRMPKRFLGLLSNNWEKIPKAFCDDLLDGVATYLSYKYGNLQSGGAWTALEEPRAVDLARDILAELENHSFFWWHHRSASNALQACAHVLSDREDAERLVFLCLGFENLRETSSVQGRDRDLITTGINMRRGHIVEALMVLTNRLLKSNVEFPELLAPALLRWAKDEVPAIRALVLRRLAYLTSQDATLGWKIFENAMAVPSGLWGQAESCLYYAYADDFEKIAPYLSQILLTGEEDDLEVWGRISALAAFRQKIDISRFLEELKTKDSTDAWRGAASVWAHPGNILDHGEMCFTGLEAGLNARNVHALEVAVKFSKLFMQREELVPVPTSLIRRSIGVLIEDESSRHHRFVGIEEWLNAISQRDPEQALDIFETYLDFVKSTRAYIHDYDENFTQLLTRLFAEAEEREESDAGQMLTRVVSVQDRLLSLGVTGVEKWLAAAERP